MPQKLTEATLRLGIACTMQINFNFRTFAGDRLGKIIREAAINGLLDDRALEVGSRAL